MLHSEMGRARSRPKRISWGSLRRVRPIARKWFERGLPIDRYYIESYLDRHRGDIRGDVLEIGDPAYTKRFGGDRVARCHLLHIEPGNPQATFVGNLETGHNIPTDAYDCIILTQTLLLIYDVRTAVSHCFAALKAGGVLLATVPGISQICRPEADDWGDYWRFTTWSLQRLLSDVVGDENVTIESFGNVLAASAFLHNLAAHELEEAELRYRDPDYQLIVAARAVKPVQRR
jgi:hypothetical protein